MRRYAAAPQLSPDQTHALDMLERRRVVEERQSRTNFTHPFLRAGAQMLMRPDLPKDRDRIRFRLLRGIAGLSAETSLSVARNLGWVRSLVDAGSESDIAFDIARKGDRSIFPATREAAFKFLLDHATELPVAMQDEIPGWSERVIIDLDDIVVDGGWPLSATPDSITSQPNWRMFAHISTRRDAPLALDIGLSRRILAALQSDPGAMSLKLVERFLHADEAVDRGNGRKADLQPMSGIIAAPTLFDVFRLGCSKGVIPRLRRHERTATPRIVLAYGATSAGHRPFRTTSRASENRARHH